MNAHDDIHDKSPDTTGHDPNTNAAPNGPDPLASLSDDDRAEPNEVERRLREGAEAGPQTIRTH